jgi:hypothetical protein
VANAVLARKRLKTPAVRYDTDEDRPNSVAISRLVSPCFATRCVCSNQNRILMDESGMIRTQMGTHSRSENDRSAWDALYNIIQ